MTEIKQLEDLIRHHRNKYYNDTPEISDDEFDLLVDKLKRLDPDNPELKNVGSPTTSIFEKYTHIYPMLSLDKATTINELKTWQDPIQSNFFVLMHKLDGISLSLHYNGGFLIRAVTRGNGVIGDNVIFNAEQIESIPRNITYLGPLEVRGEVMCSKSNFELINKDGNYANPRNFTAGSMRQIEPEAVRGRNLEFIAYKVIGGSETTLEDDFGFIEDMGFKVVDWSIGNKKYIEQYIIDHLKNLTWRDELDYEIDGWVITPSDKHSRKSLSHDGLTSDDAIAFKFPPATGVTKLLNIEWSVGKTGMVNPNAIVEPVQIGGVTVSRVNLCNMDEIDRLRVAIGDVVTIERRGDVIPKITSALPGNGRMVIAPPKTCPSCDQPTTHDSAYIMCTNPDCPAQIVFKILHNLDLLDIKDIGEKTVERLVEQGIINDFADMLNISQHSLSMTVGKKLGKRIYDNINSHKKVDEVTILCLLNIPLISRHASETLIGKYEIAQRVIEAPYHELQTIEGIGPTMANNIMEWGRSKSNKFLLELLYATLIIEEKSQSVSNIFNGLTFVITGTLSKPRTHFQNLIESHGGKIGSSVSSRTDYVLAGIDAGSKLGKAKNLGITTISEQGLYDMLKSKTT